MTRKYSQGIQSLCLPLLLMGLTVFFPQTTVALDPHKSLSQYVHDVWQDELPQGTVHKIVQTHDGFLWLGTYEGLVRFDGVQFTVLSKRNSKELKSSVIYSLYEDRKGRLWVGTGGGGLLCWQDGKFTAYTTKEGLSSNIVRTIFEDHQGVLWIGTEGGGLNRFQDGKFSAYSTKDGLTNTVVDALYEDGSGCLWIGTFGGGVNQMRDGKISTFSTSPGFNLNYVYSIIGDTTGNIFIGTSGGLCCLRNGKATTYTIKDGLLANTVWSLLEDKDGNLWVGTDGGGLSCFRDGKFTSYTSKDGLTQDTVRSLYEDFEGSIWIGTNNGLNRLQDGKFTTYTSRFGLSNNYVRTICGEPGGVVWFGTEGGGVSRLQDGKLTNFSTRDGLSSDLVKTVWVDRQGVLWIGGNNGVDCFKDGKKVTDSAIERFSGSTIYSFFEDREGTMWIGTTSSGLYEFKQGKFTVYSTKEGLFSNYIRSIHKDRQGAVWVGTNNGMNCLKDGKVTPITNLEALANSQVFAFYEDTDGNLWIGSSIGLIRFKDGKFSIYTVKDGLYDDVAFCILEGRHNELWMSCNRGIYWLNKKDFDDYDQKKIQSLPCVSYGKADGMEANQCNGGTQPAGWKTPDGKLWFPTVKGVVEIDPDHIKINTLPPPVTMVSVVVNGKFLDFSQPLILEPDAEKFEFHYAGLSFVAPEKVRFRFRLEGFDKDWSEVLTLRTAYYTNLSPGTYEFKVMACNNDSVWNQTGTSIRFRLKPPLWQTWWALLGYVMAFTGTVYGGVQFRLQTLRRRNQLLEEKVAKRTAELAKAIEQVKLSQLETEKKNKLLSQAKEELENKNQELDKKNQELDEKNQKLDKNNEELALKNEELIVSQRQADRIFSALAEALPGTVLDGKYKLEERIGTGGFGAVFRALHLGLNHHVAVKVFRPTQGNDSPDAIQRFRLEGISACRVHHPNAITILDSGVSSEGIAYLAMELLIGHTLTAEIRSHQRLSLKRCAEIIKPVCDALTEAHKAGIIHRDIKPDNIFLHQSPEGEIVKVVDFGIAKLLNENLDSKQHGLTMTGTLIGTPMYMSPERLNGDTYDGRADVYSLAVMVFEMLTGNLPFRMTERGVIEVIIRHLKEAPPKLRSFDPTIPKDVEDVVLEALGKDASTRPNAREFSEGFCKVVANYVVEETVGRSPTGEDDELARCETQVLDLNPTNQQKYAKLDTVTSDEHPTMIGPRKTLEGGTG